LDAPEVVGVSPEAPRVRSTVFSFLSSSASALRQYASRQPDSREASHDNELGFPSKSSRSHVLSERKERNGSPPKDSTTSRGSSKDVGMRSERERSARSMGMRADMEDDEGHLRRRVEDRDYSSNAQLRSDRDRSSGSRSFHRGEVGSSSRRQSETSSANQGKANHDRQKILQRRKRFEE
jgi:hypothetical protein